MAHHLLDAREAAAVLRMKNSRTLVRWARLGQVPAHPLGEGKRKLWRFLEHELLEWIHTSDLRDEARGQQPGHGDGI